MSRTSNQSIYWVTAFFLFGLFACSSEFQSTGRSNGASIVKKNNSELNAEGKFSQVGVSYSEGEESLNLVTNAMTGFKASLIGGAICWGTKTDFVFPSIDSSSLKVNKNGGDGCAIDFTEITLKTVGANTVFAITAGSRFRIDKNTSSVSQASAVFTNSTTADITKVLTVSSSSKLDLAQASISLLLSGLVTEVATGTLGNVANWEVPVGATGDVSPAPAVQLNLNGTGRVNGVAFITLKCLANGSSASKCKSGVQSATANSAVSEQNIGSMKGWIKNISANEIAALTTSSIAALAPAASARVSFSRAGTADFEAKGQFTLPSQESGKFPVLFVEHVESSVSAFKAFKLNLP